MKQVEIGILAIQGDVEENLSATDLALSELGIKGRVTPVKYVDEISSIDGLILPGGESTVIGTLAKLSGATQVIKDRVKQGMPVMGICAGMIMLATRAYDKIVGETTQELLSILDITIERNAFGRQNNSFEAEMEIPLIGKEKFNGVFIRSPVVTEVKNSVDAIATLNNKIVGVKQGNVIVTSFHPELSNDARFHKLFTSLVAEYTK
jgi:5'-phosphate synthase pdxT subunit